MSGGKDNELTFEAAFQELEETIQRLEDGELTLDEAIALFERGQALARLCDEKLEQAELRVSQLLPEVGGGYRQVPFERDA
ncbi:MAG: exodeoxyribonuclease VII small subunit [Anaerolineae bacterium]|nr:MAG: exodeoxyribonuclease VII small subunit [Anaerolineae bacterium]